MTDNTTSKLNIEYDHKRVFVVVNITKHKQIDNKNPDVNKTKRRKRAHDSIDSKYIHI